MPAPINPANVKRLVQCFQCGKVMPDPGRQRSTCPRCGTQPVPSYTYPRDSAFYPKPSRRPLA